MSVLLMSEVPLEVRGGVSDPLDLELKMVMSHHTGNGTNLGPLEEQLVFVTTEPSLQELKDSI